MVVVKVINNMGKMSDFEYLLLFLDYDLSLGKSDKPYLGAFGYM